MSYNTLVPVMLFEINPISQIEILESTEPIFEQDQLKKPGKLVARVVLQTLEERNQNGRYYPLGVGKQIIDQLGPKAKLRSLLGELDHPILSANSADQFSQMNAKKRAGVVQLKDSSHLIRDINLSENKVVGVIETLSGCRGPDLYKLIVEDKVNVGFSLRAFGTIAPSTSGNLVVQTLKAITYDAVSNPSHVNSRVVEVLPEQDMSVMQSAGTVICEGEDFELVLTEDKIQLTDDTGIYTSFIDELIESAFTKITRTITFTFT